MESKYKFEGSSVEQDKSQFCRQHKSCSFTLLPTPDFIYLCLPNEEMAPSAESSQESSSSLSKSQMETVRPNPLYKQIISQRSIFREWTEYLQGNPGRSVLFSSTQSEATSSARRIRLFQNEQRMLLFPAFINLKISSSSLSTLQYIFSVWEAKHTLRDLLEPAISSRSCLFQITRQTQSLNSKGLKIILRIMSETLKKTYSLIECFNGRIFSNFRHKHETVGWTWGIRVGRDPADIVDAVAMKFEFLNRASTVAVPYNRFLKNNNYYFCKHGNTSNSIDKHF